MFDLPDSIFVDLESTTLCHRQCPNPKPHPAPRAATRSRTTLATSLASPATSAFVEQTEAHIGSFPSAMRFDPYLSWTVKAWTGQTFTHDWHIVQPEAATSAKAKGCDGSTLLRPGSRSVVFRVAVNGIVGAGRDTNAACLLIGHHQRR
jgi:hypothetical protein